MPSVGEGWDFLRVQRGQWSAASVDPGGEGGEEFGRVGGVVIEGEEFSHYFVIG